ncbi:TPA: YadA-like family protein [Escherichia albertii]|uniref:YadA-like family protein n=1 Tax=Escherichia albertii TaxID=208962 RepID=UPI0012310509|nr:YadA-like family protein [Escherichia albertii]EEW0114888.1 adhesin [Escherichia albertii]EFO0969458.1 adhesin [Escherichia albertii]MDD9758236.1 YadA-like family protein [Escherichia albertii]WRT54655.1 YadA-like family protein [Escherichia albertii]HEB1520463.1 YadA-like family protein [Escherichia albertii]
MNKIFKVIWNPATGSYSVASETAKSRGKKSGRSKLLISALVAGGLLSSFGAYAAFTGDGGKSAEEAAGGTPLTDGWIAIGKGAIATAGPVNSGTSSVAIGQEANAGLGSTALGFTSYATGERSVAMGQATKALGSRAIAIGSAAKANKDFTIALGNTAQANSDYAMALGKDTNATGLYSLAIGYNSKTSKDNAIALGNGSKSDGINAIAIGDGSASGGDNSLALGSQSKVTANNSVALGAGSVAATDDTVSVGNSTTQRKIVNMDKGEISNTSTEAINGSQLYAISKSVSDRLGGGSSVNTNGTINAPSYALKSGTYNNVGAALTGIDEDTLHWNSTSNKFSASHGSSTTNIITNVADGDVAAGSTDAVNGSQLKTTNDNVTTNTTNITNLQDAVDGLGDDALQWDNGKTAFSAAHGASTTSKITNVADGSLAAGSTDAVNGSQLKTTNDNVTTNTTNITTLQDAVDGLGDDALQWDNGKTAFSAAHGASTTSKITNVADGSLAAGSTDAVNGSQLKTTNDNVTTNTTNITTLQDAVDGLGDDALQWDNGKTAFSASHGTSTTSKITNVTAGALTAASTDAINGSQLYDFSSAIADTLGGGSTVGADGMFSAPTYTIGGTDYDNLGDALTAINASVGTSLGDALMWDDSSKSYSASRAGVTSKITNVAAGALSATSTDAVNGSQLYGVSNSVVDALGGGSTMNADGTINAPTYSIANTDYSNIGDALSAIDASLDDSLLWDASAGAFSAAHGTDTASKITNVANGRIAADSTDAVNGSQLFTTNQMITQIAGNTSNTYVEEHGAGVNYIRTNDTGLVFEDASASGIGATAVGYNSVASATGSVAIGQDSSSNVESGVALGSGSVSNRFIVKGSRNTSITENGVVIGYDTTDGELLGALSIGDDGKYRQIINVADGSEAHDAVTVRQLQNAIGSVATTPTKYYHANSTAEDSLAVGEDSLAIGAKTIVNGDAGIGIGLNTLVLADAINGIAIGSNAHANHANSIAMGNGSETTRGAQTGYTAYNMDAPQNSVGEFSVGSEDGQRQITNVAAGSQDTDAVNVGQLKVTDAQVAQNTQSITNLNTQVGNLDTRVSTLENGMGDIITTGSTKYFKANTDGVDANAQGKDSVAIGSGSIAAADNSVALGTGSEANEENTVSVGSSTNQRRITNVAAGKNDTDAVNVAQLKSSEAGSVRYATNEDGSINYTTMNLGDGKGGTTRISNVSAGVNNNDAVNYAQLKQSVQETKQYTDQRMVEMDNKLSKTESKLSGGIASAMAMTGLPQAYTPGASMTSIGGGTYNGESAVALGVSMVSANGRWVYKLQGSTNSQGEYSAAVGAGIQW